MSFDQALAELEKIVDDLESADVPLEDAIKLFERAMRLKTVCERKLAAARARVEQVVSAEGEEPRLEPFEPPL